MIHVPFTDYWVLLSFHSRSLIKITRATRLSPTCFAAQLVWASGFGRVSDRRYL